MSLLEMSGDRDRTFETWLERYRPAFERFFRRRGCAPALAADLTQDTLVRIWTSRASFRGEGEASFRSWGYRIATTIWLKHLRGYKPLLDPFTDELPGPSVDPADRAAEEEIVNALRAAIAELPAQMQRVVLLFGLGRTEQEIGMLLRCTVNTVKAHMHQARHKLALRLEARFKEPIDTGGRSQSWM